MLLTGGGDHALVSRAAQARACAVLPKSGALPDLMNALRTAGTGGLLVHPALVAAPAAPPERHPDAGVALSPREQDMLSRLTIGWGTEASRLGQQPADRVGFIAAVGGGDGGAETDGHGLQLHDPLVLVGAPQAAPLGPDQPQRGQ